MFTSNNIDSIEYRRDSKGSESIQIEVIDEIPPPKFHPPLTGPFDPVLLRVKEHFSEPFFLFNNLHTMFGTSDSLSMGVPTTSSYSFMGGTSMVSPFPSISVVGSTSSMPSASDYSIWGISSVTSFASTSMSSVSTSIPSLVIPTPIVVFNGGGA
jgi:hypothetical protein